MVVLTAAHLSSLFAYLYALVRSPWLLCHFTFDVLIYALPWARPAEEWSLNQAIRMRVIRLVLLYWSLTRSGNRLTVDEGKEKNRFQVILPKSSKVYQGAFFDAIIKPEPLGLTWTPARPPPAELVRDDMTVALHFHGGGFVIGDGRDRDTGYLARTLIRHMGCTHVCTPQYRLSSGKNGRFPAPFQDALTAYLHLLRENRIPASQVILSGDSAGGNIALGLLRYIHQHGRELEIPPPGAVTLWSPWVDVSAAIQQDMTKSPNYRTDYLNKEFGRWGATTISGSGAVDPSGLFLSPLHHPFEADGCVPMFVNAGEREVLCDDIEDFSERYRGVGWPLHLLVSKGCPHDILLLGSRIGFDKEAEEAAKRARAFLLQTTRMRLRDQAN